MTKVPAEAPLLTPDPETPVMDCPFKGLKNLRKNKKRRTVLIFIR
jgi:hypothetical protein